MKAQYLLLVLLKTKLLTIPELWKLSKVTAI